MSDRPGKEIPKEYRAVIEHQIDTFGWRYDNSRKGHPYVWPSDKSVSGRPVPTTPGDQHSLKNFIGWVRRSGGEWPAGRRQR